MTGDPRGALERLISAFNEHFAIARQGDDAHPQALEDAEEALRDAFFTYDDVLFTRFGVELPFDLLDEDFDDDDEEDDDLDDDEDDDLDEDFDDDEDDDFVDVDD